MARQFRLIRWAFGFVALAASFALHAQVAISPQIAAVAVVFFSCTLLAVAGGRIARKVTVGRSLLQTRLVPSSQT